MLLSVQFPVFDLQRLVQLHIVNNNGFHLHLRLHPDDPSALHQLQAEISRPSALAHAHLQIFDHHNRRYVRISGDDAVAASAELFPRW